MLTPEQQFNQHLRYKSRRPTKAREKILKMLFQNHSHMHLEDILKWAQGNAISRATLFRTLNLLVEAGMVSKIFDEHNRAHYEHVYAHAQHYHLICLQCGNIHEVEAPFSEEAVQKLCDDKNFIQHYNVFKVFGHCSGCAKDSSGRTGRK